MIMKYSYKNFTYDPYVEETEDNRKLFHDVFDPSGELVRLTDWFENISPYRAATREEFESAVDFYLNGEFE